MASFFEILDDIGKDKNYLPESDPDILKQFSPYSANKHFSYFKDTIFQANENNFRYHEMTKKDQYDFLYHSITARKRWRDRKIKQDKDDTEVLEVIKEYYHYSDARADEVRHLFSKDDIDFMRMKLDKGGKRKGI